MVDSNCRKTPTTSRTLWLVTQHRSRGCPGRGLASQSAFLLTAWWLTHLLFFCCLIDCKSGKFEKEKKSLPHAKQWTPPQVTGRRGEKKARLSLPPWMPSTCPLRSPPRSLPCQTLIHPSWTLGLLAANKPPEKGRKTLGSSQEYLHASLHLLVNSSGWFFF